MTLPSAAVIVSSGPTGAAPCETHGSSSTPSKRTPTAPSAITSSPRNSAPPPSAVRAGGEAAEERDHRRALGEEAQDGVGRERVRVGEQDDARGAVEVGHPGQRAAALDGLDGRVERARPAVAQRRRPHGDAGPVLDLPAAGRARRRRRSRSSWSGASTSCTASSVASGAVRWAPEANSDHEVAAARRPVRRARPPRPPRRAGVAGPGASRGRCRCGRASRATILPPRPYSAACRRRPSSRSSARRASARPRWRSRWPSACAREGEDPVAVSADALQVYAGLETLTGAPTAAERARLEHRLVGFLPVTETCSAGAYARRAHAEIDALLAAGPPADRRRRHRPLPARRARRARPAPAAGPRGARALDAPRSAARGAAGAARRARRARSRGGRRAIAPDRRPADRARARAARGRRDAAAPGARPQLWTARHPPPDAARRATMDRAALGARIDARVDAMVAAGAVDEVRARRRGRRVADGAARRSASRSCCAATSRR